MLKEKIKHTQRYQEIMNAFLKNGFSHFLFRIGLINSPSSTNSSEKGSMNLQDIGIKLRETMQKLGPTFIKLGQIASTRRDIIPDEIADELEKLQDDVQSFPFEIVKDIIEHELKDSLDHLFKEFETTPLATASIGQVHVAKLLSGKEVAIKVQRPDIVPSIEIDLDILQSLANMIESRWEWAKTYHLKEMIEEFSNSLHNELNYRMEGRNSERIAKQFRETKAIHIPTVYWDYTTNKVLTMERIVGIKVNHFDKLKEDGYDLSLLAERIAQSMLHQILEEGLFHGDPHSGNIYIMPNNRIAYLDFGMVGRLSDDLKYHFTSLIINLQKGDTNGIIKTFTKWGVLNEDTNMTTLQRDIDMLQTKYYDVPFKEISLGKVIIDVFTIAYKHKIEIPTDITILGKVILTLESIIEKLDPTFSIMKAIEPYGKRLLLKRFNPKNIAQHSWDQLIENIEYLSELPKDIQEITNTIKKGKLRLDINMNELHNFLKRLDRVSNRLSFSIILLSFSILMGGLIIGASILGQTTLLFRLPVIEFGFVIATLMFLFMIYTIIRSGKM
ncbi:AarF/ABC1/UbiB kinase family protein [Pseudogracilibacillus sp. SE30717A]|uniref:ABC1 kinase family protein n=1 Tax=Pseudogracilibacillus sp. SE30717A TaxID=3098293 RepID=UPI00300DE4D4